MSSSASSSFLASSSSSGAASRQKKQWIVRPTTNGDEEAINRLLKTSYETLLPRDYDSELLEVALPLITKARPELLTSGTWYAVEDPHNYNNVVGCGGWTPNNPMNKETGAPHLRHFATDPNCTRQGIARAIWEKIWNEITNTLGPDTPLEVFSTLTAKPFYESLGFEEEKLMEIPLTQDWHFPCVLMRRNSK